MSQILATRDLCARALDGGQPNPWVLGGSAAAVESPVEQDFVFFAPLPAPGEMVFTRSRSESAEDGAGSLLTQILDGDDRLLAEGWTNTAASVRPHRQEPATVLARGPESADAVRGTDLLAAHLGSTRRPGSLRRFRVRIGAGVSVTAETACAERELQRYERDGEQLADLALTCALPDGTVVAEAWATCAV